MPNGTPGVKRKRRPAQRGVQAVFTPNTDWKGKTQLAFGLTAIVLGTGAWTYTTRAPESFGLGNIVPWNTTLSAILLPLSIPLLIGGAGLSTYYLAMRRTWRASNRIESALYELEALVGQKHDLGESVMDKGASTTVTSAKKPRFSLGQVAMPFAFAEAIVLLVMYGGIVREYTANSNMQIWVHANFETGSYFLNYNAVLALAGILGVLIFQLVPRKLRSKKTQAHL